VTLIYGFIVCTLSNIGFCLLLTLMFKDSYFLVEVIFFYHFITLFSIRLIQAKNILLDYYLYFNGIYTYYYIFNSQINPVIGENIKTSTNISSGFIFGIPQVVVYFTFYVIIVGVKYRSTNNK
jgi:hypothetical protein